MVFIINDWNEIKTVSPKKIQQEGDVQLVLTSEITDRKGNTYKNSQHSPSI